jgi:superfamily II DNA or RNA helicase
MTRMQRLSARLSKELRADQSKAISAALGSLRRGRSPLIVMPTGTGKSIVATAVLAEFLGRRKRALVVIGSDALLVQWTAVLTSAGFTVGVEKAGQRADDDAQVVVASVQTIGRENGRRAFDPDAFAVVVFDEAHHAPASSWRRVADRYRCPKLGLTATPDRLDEQSLGVVFDDVPYTMELIEAIEQGLVVPIVQRSVFVEAIDVSRVESLNRDLRKDQIAKVVIKAKALQGVAVPLLDHMGDRKTIAFAASVAHARALARVLNRKRRGVAVVLDGEDTAERREKVLADFRAGRFQILVNCGLFLEGFDLPEVACVAMARPTKSRLLYAQAIGRATRLHPGKTDCLILDFCGNAGRHKLVTAIDLLARPGQAKGDDGERPGVKAAAKDLIKGDPTLAAHMAMERARRLPADVLERYRTVDVDLFPSALDELRRGRSLNSVATESGISISRLWALARENGIDTKRKRRQPRTAMCPVCRQENRFKAGEPWRNFVQRKTCGRYECNMAMRWAARPKKERNVCAVVGCSRIASRDSDYCSIQHGIVGRKALMLVTKMGASVDAAASTFLIDPEVLERRIRSWSAT